MLPVSFGLCFVKKRGPVRPKFYLVIDDALELLKADLVNLRVAREVLKCFTLLVLISGPA